MEIFGAVFSLLLIIIGLTTIIGAIFFWPKEQSSSDHQQPYARKLAVFGGIAILLLFLLTSSIKIVGAGEVGVVKHFGAVESSERSPGINLVVPFFTDIVNVDGRIQGIPFENLGAASKEYQDVFLTGILNVHVEFDKVAELYQTVGLDYKEKLVIPFYANLVKEIVPQFGIAEVLPKRELIRQLTVEKLKIKLAPYGIAVDDVAISNINFNEQYNQAIQDKQIQELRVQTEKNILEQKRIQAEQVQIAAQGEAQAQIERAKGVAEANRLIAASLSDTILLNSYIDKLADNVEIMLIPSGQDFLLDLRNLIAQQPQ